MKKVKSILMIISVVCILAGCNIENEEKNQQSSDKVSQTVTSSAATTTPVSTTLPVTQSTVSAFIDPDEVIPPAIQSAKVEGDRLSYTLTNVYSQENYYTVIISGVKMNSTQEADMETTYIKEDLYGDFRLELMKKGELIDSLKINVPRDDRFLILESVADKLTYGCEVISNKRNFRVNTYPDLIQLDFHIIEEAETPQYARFFTVFDDQIVEVPVYENGVETAPYGTHVDLVRQGVMTQHIVASDIYGNYTVNQYEYTFNTEDRCLIRQQVPFTG